MDPSTPQSEMKRSRAPERERLDILVYERGLAPSRERAHAYILEGIVLVDDKPADKPGMKYPFDSAISLKRKAMTDPYVSRGALKLAAALDAFHLNPAGNICIDVGASTGGFTDVLLQRNAAAVFAIDTGYNKIALRLREDPRVRLLERTNIRYVEHLPEHTLAQCAAIDVSFISLKLVIPAVAALLTENSWIVALVKPQFEADRQETSRGKGIIRDTAIHRRILRDLRACIGGLPLALKTVGLIPSPITGKKGNHEFLLWIQRDFPASNSSLSEISDDVIESVIAQTVEI